MTIVIRHIKITIHNANGGTPAPSPLGLKIFANQN